MNVYTLECTQTLPNPLSRVFPFFEKPENLARITPRNLGFRILTPSPIVMKVGTLVDYTIRLGGIPVRWRTLITTYEPPFQFVDEQIKGPYAFWHHRHLFRDLGGSTEMRDVVHYALPAGILGTLAHALYIRRRLEQIFRHRSEVIGRILGEDDGE
jgi:hypothetical protein